MQTIPETIDVVTCGVPQGYLNFSATPLSVPGTGEVDYLTLDEALAGGIVRVTEVSETARVSELRFENQGATAVLLLDGEELVGAMQNRIFNLSILVPPMQVITVPVSCVEAGRWSTTTRAFRSESRAFYARGRARKADQITEALRTTGSRTSRQQDIWQDIADKSSRMGSRSQSAAMSAMYEDHRAQLNKYTEAVATEPDQVGAIFRINGQVRGLELFDFPETARKLMPKIARSYALDALDQAEDEASKVTDADFLNMVSVAPGRSFSSVGEGTDIRFTSRRCAGGALSARGRIIHLSAFLRSQRHGFHPDKGGDADLRRY